MKLFILYLGFFLSASNALGFDMPRACKGIFQNTAVQTTSISNVKPSLSPDRRRYDLEDFVIDTFGYDFLQSSRQIVVELKLISRQFETVLEKVEALKILPVVSVDEPEEDVIMVRVDARELMNLLATFVPKDYFLATYFHPRSHTFTVEL